MIYGKLNENLQKIMSTLIQSNNLVKFLWYLDLNKDILSLPNLSNNDKLSLIHGSKKKIFPRRKVPSVGENSADCYVCIRYVNIAPNRRNSKSIHRQVLKFYIICHESLCDTMNGQRDLCIVEAIREMFDESHIMGVGKTQMPLIIDLQTPNDYVGYEIIYEITDFEDQV